MDLLLCLVDNNDRAVNWTLPVILSLDLLIVLTVELVTPPLLYPHTVI